MENKKNKLMFHEEVDDKVAWFNVFNIIFLLLTLGGGAFLANQTATLPTSYGWTSFDDSLFIATLAVYAIPAVLLFILFKLLINIYGEKVRGNYYKQMMLEKMNDE